jgi:UDPglucose 6-dehydrogenase
MSAHIGFIGQGWIGKHYADDFEARLYEIVRYSLEEPYIQNKEAINQCDIVFVAVPTPTTPDGYSYAPVENALQNVKKGATVVVKSTLAPGTTQKLQESFPELYILHSPEFLREASAAYDAAKPNRNIIGIPKDTQEYKRRAEEVLRILPEAPYNKIMSAKEAELVKYAGNCFLYTKVIYMNMLHDLVSSLEVSWEPVREALIHDPRIGESHTQPVHDSGRGAGGDCFIKDFEAFKQLYIEKVSDQQGADVLKAMIELNNKLLISSDKSIDLLKGVYGDEVLKKYNT